MKKLLLLFACVASFLFCSESTLKADPVCTAFPYFEMGLGPFPLPVPHFGAGLRSQHDHNGFDLSFRAATIVAATHLKGSALYHYYPKPFLESELYVGCGVGLGALFDHHFSCDEMLISPEFVIGRRFLNSTCENRFFQMQVSWPTFNFSDGFYYPLIVLSYGIGF